MLPIDYSLNLQLWPKLRCLETRVINRQEPNAAPFLTPADLGTDPCLRYISTFYFWPFLLLVNSDFGSILGVF
jgi:hypothetical protein